jgi:AraC-like DNA-binding protein
MSDEQGHPIRYFAPDADLAELISTFYIAYIPVAHFDELERADRPQVRLRLNDSPGEYHFAGGLVCEAWGATIIGPTSAPVRAICHGPVHLVGMGLMPGGWATLMGPEADKYTDRALPAHQLFGDWIYQVAEAIAGAESEAVQLGMLQELAREMMRRGEPAPMWFTRAVDEWLACNLSPQVDDLVAATGMSARSVERLTKRFYGVSPKVLARKYRALRAASALARGEKLDEGALAEAFYDQSHLIREVKQFAGATPGQLAKPSIYTRATTTGRNLLRGKVSPLITDT